MAGKQVLSTHNLHLVSMGQAKLYRETKCKGDGFTFYTRMKTTPVCLTQNVTETMFRPRGLFFVCLVWVAFPMSTQGDCSVGFAQGNVLMSWRTNVTDISGFRFVVNPNGANIIFFPIENVTGTAVPSYSSKVTEIGNVSLGTVSFRLLSLTVADAGRYYYKAHIIGSADGGQVLVIAGIPADITVLEVSDPLENEKYTMQCSAQSTSVPLDMGLTMHYKWKRGNNQNIIESDRYSFSSNQSNLIINPLQRQDAGNFSCEAWEDVGAVSQSAPFSLKVIYGPDPGNIQLSPNRTSHDVTESSSLSVNCSTDCFPDCQYSWTGPDGMAKTNTSMLSIISVGRNQAGHYICTASNSRIANKTTTSAINVIVLYGPDAPLALYPATTSYRGIEGTFITNITCSADCNPPCNYQWIGPLGATSSGVLSLGTYDRIKRGSYFCMATNPRTSTSCNGSTIYMVVIYGPDIPYLSPSTTVYTKLEGESLPDINCSADCFPSCTQVWMKGSSTVQESNGKTLSLRQVTREKAGDYTCWFNNTESRATGNISIKLIVQYPPVLTMKATNTSKEGRVVFNCTANGVPDNYRFYKLIHMAPDESRTIVRELGLTRVSNSEVSFTIEKVTYQDTGFYVCKASNGITHYSTGQLVMEDMVSVWITGTFFIENKKSMFIGMINKSATIEIPFYSNPSSTTVKLYKGANTCTVEVANTSDTLILLSSSLNTFTFYDKEVLLNAQIVVLHFRTVKLTEYGEYTVVLFSDNGSTSGHILFSSGKPETPAKFHINDVQEKQVTLQWLSGDHSEFDQMFVIQISMDNFTWTNASLINAGKKEGWFSANIAGLKSNTVYYFRLYSFNVNGESDFAEINFATRTLKESTSSLDIGASIGIGFGGFFLGVVGTISVIIIIWKRITATPKYNSTREADMSTDMQIYANTEVSSSPALSHYEQFQQDRMEKTMYDRI